MKLIRQYWQQNPLLLIVSAALFFRLLAVVFSQGYGMHDDHFLVIEASQSWVDGEDYNNWLPWNQQDPKPEGHSFFYVGLHYLFFSLLEYTGIFDPKIKMYIIRFLHALFSLIVVITGFRITEKLYNRDTAKQVGLFLALLWFMPFLSVRNLVEIVCIPFLMLGIWIIITSEKGRNMVLQCFLAGLIMGLAFSVRFQTLIFIGGVGLAMLIQQKWKGAVFFGLGALLSIVIIQGVTDYVIWGYPFAELAEYVIYNFTHKYSYFIGPWYLYILLICGILIPPLSIFLFFGFLRTWKKYLLLFLPAFLFLVFHSYFPNKQERFIFPIIPFIVILGFIGWNEFMKGAKFWQARKKILTWCMTFFWVINLLVLPFISTAYSKRSRVESMVYLSRYGNIRHILLEDTNHNSIKMLPKFYLRQWEVGFYELTKSNPLPNWQEYFRNVNKTEYPKFVLFFEETDLKQRIEAVQSIFPVLQYETTIEPGFIDKVMYWLNPVNKSQTIYIYKIGIGRK